MVAAVVIGLDPAGAGLGLLGGLGLLVAVLASPPLRRARLQDRLAPYLRDRPRASRLLARPPARTPLGTVDRLLRPTLLDAARGVERVLGGASSVRRRLTQLGRGQTLEELRVEQVLWGAAAFLVALLGLLVLLSAGVRTNPLSGVLVCLVALAAGVTGRDYWLTAQVRRRESAMQAEFPTVAELLALAVAAGEGPVGALERVCRLGHGELSRELGVALAQARAGATLVAALEGVAARTSLESLARFVDGLVVAIERGTPLAEVLRAQAGDVREAAKRALLESGGRREITMMMPVVFGVLPVTVVFALYPGLVNITSLTR